MPPSAKDGATYVVTTKPLQPLQLFPNGEVKLLATMVVNNKLVTRVTCQSALKRYRVRPLDEKAVRREERTRSTKDKQTVIRLEEEERQRRISETRQIEGASMVLRAKNREMARSLAEQARAERLQALLSARRGSPRNDPTKQLEEEERQRRCSVVEDDVKDTAAQRSLALQQARQKEEQERESRVVGIAETATQNQRARRDSVEQAILLQAEEQQRRMEELQTAEGECAQERAQQKDFARLASENERTRRLSEVNEVDVQAANERSQNLALASKLFDAEQLSFVALAQQAQESTRMHRLASTEQADRIADDELAKKLESARHAREEESAARNQSIAAANKLADDEQRRFVEDVVADQQNQRLQRRQSIDQVIRQQHDEQRDRVRDVDAVVQQDRLQRQQSALQAKQQIEAELQRIGSTDDTADRDSDAVVAKSAILREIPIRFQQKKDPKMISEARRAFYQHPNQEDGMLPIEDIRNVLATYDQNLNPLTVDRVATKYEQSPQSHISYHEFCRVLAVLERPDTFHPDIIETQETTVDASTVQEAQQPAQVVTTSEPLGDGDLVNEPVAQAAPADSTANAAEPPKIRRQLSASQIAAASRRVFYKYDKQGQGTISGPDLLLAVAELGHNVNSKKVKQVLKDKADSALNFHQFNRVVMQLERLPAQDGTETPRESIDTREYAQELVQTVLAQMIAECSAPSPASTPTPATATTTAVAKDQDFDVNAFSGEFVDNILQQAVARIPSSAANEPILEEVGTTAPPIQPVELSTDNRAADEPTFASNPWRAESAVVVAELIGLAIARYLAHPDAAQVPTESLVVEARDTNDSAQQQLSAESVIHRDVVEMIVAELLSHGIARCLEVTARITQSQAQPDAQISTADNVVVTASPSVSASVEQSSTILDRAVVESVVQDLIEGAMARSRNLQTQQAEPESEEIHVPAQALELRAVSQQLVQQVLEQVMERLAKGPESAESHTILPSARSNPSPRTQAAAQLARQTTEDILQAVVTKQQQNLEQAATDSMRSAADHEDTVLPSEAPATHTTDEQQPSRPEPVDLKTMARQISTEVLDSLLSDPIVLEAAGEKESIARHEFARQATEDLFARVLGGLNTHVSSGVGVDEPANPDESTMAADQLKARDQPVDLSPSSPQMPLRQLSAQIVELAISSVVERALRQQPQDEPTTTDQPAIVDPPSPSSPQVPVRQLSAQVVEHSVRSAIERALRQQPQDEPTTADQPAIVDPPSPSSPQVPVRQLSAQVVEHAVESAIERALRQQPQGEPTTVEEPTSSPEAPVRQISSQMVEQAVASAVERVMRQQQAQQPRSTSVGFATDESNKPMHRTRPSIANPAALVEEPAQLVRHETEIIGTDGRLLATVAPAADSENDDVDGAAILDAAEVEHFHATAEHTAPGIQDNTFQTNSYPQPAAVLARSISDASENTNISEMIANLGSGFGNIVEEEHPSPVEAQVMQARAAIHSQAFSGHRRSISAIDVSSVSSKGDNNDPFGSPLQTPASSGREVLANWMEEDDAMTPHSTAARAVGQPMVSAITEETQAQDDAPATQDDAPAAQGGAPATQDDAPATQDDAPATQGDVPATQGDVPAAQGGAPATQDDAPATQDDAPATQDDAPTTQDDVPATQDAPATQDDAPATQDDLPATQDDVPAAKDDAQDDAPTAQDDAPAEPEKPRITAEDWDAEFLRLAGSKAGGLSRQQLREICFKFGVRPSPMQVNKFFVDKTLEYHEFEQLVKSMGFSPA